MAQRSNSTMIVLLLLVLGGGGLITYLLTRPEPAPPRRIERPERPEPTKSLVTAPPPLPPELPPPPTDSSDAGAPEKLIKRGGVAAGPRCNGEIDASAVRRYAQQNSGAVRRCYERRLKANNMLQGRMAIGITIGTSGQAQGVRIDSDSVRDPEVSSCVRQVVGAWRLPAPSGGCAQVSVPFTFTPATR